MRFLTEMLVLIVFGASLGVGLAQVVQPVESAKIDAAALNKKLDTDLKILKLQAQVASRDRDNAVLAFQALQAQYTKQSADLNTNFTKATDDLEKARKAIFQALGLKDDSKDVTFDGSTGEFKVAAPVTPAAPPTGDKK